MQEKLEHKIIVLTGEIASGKTFVRQILTSILDKIGLNYLLISGLHDLYLPFAKQHGMIREASSISREETTLLMRQIYQIYGQELGTQLLYDFLLKNGKDNLYILDSKRNPQGIKELKDIIADPLVIGVKTRFAKRIERFQARNRDFDHTSSGEQRDPHEVFRNEEDVFKVSQAIAISDVLIENSLPFPYHVHVKLIHSLLDYALKTKLPAINTDRALPRPKHPEQDQSGLLQTLDIPPLLDRFYDQNRDKNIFVIQGGNKYITTYLESIAGRPFFELKLTSVNKVRYSVSMQTALNPQERASHIDPSLFAEIKAEYANLPTIAKEEIHKRITVLGFKDLEDILIYGTREEILDCLLYMEMKSPFSPISDDAKVVSEFSEIDSYLERNLSDFSAAKLIQKIFLGTQFYNAVHDPNKKVVFLDDVLYRGRTFYTLCLILSLLGVDRDKWKFFCLCQYEVSNQINDPNIEVLNKEKRYQFENSLKTERGYWEENDQYFSYRDLDDYFHYLCILHKDQNTAANLTSARWELKLQNLSQKIIREMQLPLGSDVIKDSLGYFIFCTHFGIPIDFAAISDQRAKNIGYSVPFIRMVDSFIGQEVSDQERALFKQSIKQLFTQLVEKARQNWDPDFQEIFDFYAKNATLIDYHYLYPRYISNEKKP